MFVSGVFSVKLLKTIYPSARVEVPEEPAGEGRIPDNSGTELSEMNL